MLSASRKRRLVDDQEQNASKRSRSSSSSDIIIIDDDDQPSVPMATKIDHVIALVSGFFRKLFGQSRHHNHPSTRQYPTRQSTTQSNPVIVPSQLTSREQILSYTIEEDKHQQQYNNRLMSFPSPDTDIYCTGQSTISSEGNSVGRLPTHSLPPLQSTPLTYSDYSFNKQRPKTIIPKKSTMKKIDRQSSGVLERVNQEREDVMFQQMIASMTINNNTTINDNTVNNISPIVITDSLGSLSTINSHKAPVHKPSHPSITPSPPIHLYSSLLSQYHPPLSHGAKHRPHQLLDSPNLSSKTQLSVAQSKLSRYKPSSLLKSDSDTCPRSSSSDPEELSFGWGKTTPQLVTVLPPLQYVTTPRLIPSPNNIQDAFENNWLEEFSKSRASMFADYKSRIETLKKYNEIYKQERIETDDRRTTKIERLNSLTIRPWTPNLEVDDEDESDLTLDLPEDSAATVDRVWCNGNVGEVFVERKNIRITRGDLLTLRGLEWLNDEVINFYLSLVIDTVNDTIDRKVHLFNSFFYPKIMSNGYSGVRRWTKKVDIFSYDIILLPVHLGMHWCLASIDFNRQKISYYDSLRGSNRKCLQVLRDYLVSESLDKKNKEYDVSNWTLECCEDIPHQHNGSDCGVFTCMYARHLARDKPMNFSQDDLPAVRRMMVAEIVSNQLLFPN